MRRRRRKRRETPRGGGSRRGGTPRGGGARRRRGARGGGGKTRRDDHDGHDDDGRRVRVGTRGPGRQRRRRRDERDGVFASSRDGVFASCPPPRHTLVPSYPRRGALARAPGTNPAFEGLAAVAKLTTATENPFALASSPRDRPVAPRVAAKAFELFRRSRHCRPEASDDDARRSWREAADTVRDAFYARVRAPSEVWTTSGARARAERAAREERRRRRGGGGGASRGGGEEGGERAVGGDGGG